MIRLLLIPLIALLAVTSACSGDDDSHEANEAPTRDESPVLGEGPSPEATGVPDGLAYVFDSVTNNIDIEEMRPYLGDDLASMDDAEIADAVFCFPVGVVADVTNMNVNREGDQASLTVTWTVTGDGAVEPEQTVKRTWSFARESTEEASGYLITGLPSECPFESADAGSTVPAVETPGS